ncbi:host specificity factor TipJ family phage tail protein [Brucella anthropi]|uniref:host specificity factor TipJ family phage tail protein n=1 Tax=Brucella anthropi TaxID=529 RepID=UPI003850060E
MTVPVLAAPAFDPGCERIEMVLPEGMTVGEIISTALPGATDADKARCRVALVTDHGSVIVQREYWRQVRPRPGVRVVIRLIPGKNALKSILSIVVAVAAVALGAMFGPALGAFLGFSGSTAAAVGTGIIGLGVNLLGNLLINALIPPARPDDERRNSYSISGWNNRLEPDGAVPVVLGEIRHAPPFAARSWSEIIGDWQYVHALFNFGEGPLELSDFRIGDTSISEYDEVDIEVREGRDTDPPVSLYPRQILEENIGVELTRPLVRDDLGEVVDSEPAVETPVVRTTGADAAGATLVLAFPAGLIRFNDEGKKRQRNVRVRVEQRLVQAEEWQAVITLDITAKKTEAFYRQHTWSFPSRGRWQVRLTMMTDESDDSKVQQRTVWAALQTLRPEYPLNYARPLALVALRVKATHQLSGTLDNFTALCKRVCPDWDHGSGQWVMRATSNPASLYRYVLECPANQRMTTEEGIDLDQLADWHDFCREKGLHYNRVLDQAGFTLREVLTEIAAAGRASPRHDGSRWGVVIDRPASLIVDHVNPRNSWNFSTSRAYVDKPHAWIVRFQDQGNDYKEAQRIIRRPGYTGDITVTETLDLPGLTDPAIIYREGLRRFYEAEYRPDVYEATQDGSVRVVTRGDAVMLSHDVLSQTHWAGRVRTVSGNLVELDEAVTMVAGKTYAISFRVFASASDTVGTSAVRTVASLPGETSVIVLSGSGALPTAGDLAHFGRMGTESYQLLVSNIEMTEDQCTIIRAVDAAPIIDTLTDAAVIPAWSSRVGAEIDENLLQPPAPRFTSITSGVSGAGQAGLVTFLIEPGSGTISTASFVISHRSGTSGAWTDMAIPVANGGGEITGYTNGATVQIRAHALSLTGVAGPATDIVTMVIGSGDAPIPAALDPEQVSTTPLLGGALIQLATGADANTSQVQLYRSMSSVLNRETDRVGAPHPVSPLQSFSFALGDTMRDNLVMAGSMDNPSAWLAGTGWSIADSRATHAPTVESALGQAFPAEAGKWYRLGYSVSDCMAGSVTPRLTGGSDRAGTPVSANGFHRDRIQAVTGNNHIGFNASASFSGSIDDVVAYLETPACLAQGTHYIWVEPQNMDGVPGPVTGPLSIDIT